MNLELLTLCVLLATSCAISFAMLIAWLYLNREPYALLWALACGGAALQWTITILAHALAPEALVPPILTGFIVIVDSSLILVAFRHRAGLPLRLSWLAVYNLAMLAALIVAVAVVRDLALRTFITNFGCGLLFVATAAAVMARGRKARLIEIGYGGISLVFAMFEILLAVLALRIGSDALAPTVAAYRIVLGIGLPASYVALGLGAVMLLVSDLSERLSALGTRDPITGALNRRGLDQAAVAAMASARRHRLPLSIIVVEVRGLPRVASRAGRRMVDELLIQAADQLHASMREDDVFAHLERFRFCVLLADTGIFEAMAMGAHAQSELVRLWKEAGWSEVLHVRHGVAQLKSDDFAFGAMLKRAEEAMLMVDSREGAARSGGAQSAA